MELVERYLQAVRFWLPKEQKHDIIAELSEDLHAQIEEQERALGRTLKEADVEAILKARGNPILVANRYLPQRSLIGPVLFPVYCFVLKIVALCWVIPSLIWLFTAVFVPLYPAGYNGQPLLSGFGTFWFTAFVASSTVTLVFALIERAPGVKSRLFEDWNPRKLPPVRDLRAITRPAASFELAANLLMTVWWAAYMSSPVVWDQPAVRISLSPVWWPYFFWGFLVIGTITTAISAANLLRPYWTGLKATVRLCSDCAGAVLLCWLLKANIVIGLSSANLSVDRAQQLTDAINLWTARMLPAAIILAIVIALTGVFRIARLKTTRFRLPWETAVSA